MFFARKVDFTAGLYASLDNNMYFCMPKFKECQGGFMVTIKRAENVRKILGDTSSIPQAPPKYPSSTPQVDKLLLAFGGDYLSIIEIMALVGLKDRKSFREKYLNPAIEKGFIEMLYPKQQRHPKQNIACRQWGWVIEAQ